MFLAVHFVVIHYANRTVNMNEIKKKPSTHTSSRLHRATVTGWRLIECFWMLWHSVGGVCLCGVDQNGSELATVEWIVNNIYMGANFMNIKSVFLIYSARSRRLFSLWQWWTFKLIECAWNFKFIREAMRISVSSKSFFFLSWIYLFHCEWKWWGWTVLEWLTIPSWAAEWVKRRRRWWIGERKKLCSEVRRHQRLRKNVWPQLWWTKMALRMCSKAHNITDLAQWQTHRTGLVSSPPLHSHSPQ